MSLHSWLQNLRSALAPGRPHHRRPGPRQGARRRLNAEVLEVRCVPAQYAVTWLGFQAADLNEAGQIVGDDGNHALLLNGDNLIDLGTLGGSYSYATGI